MCRYEETKSPLPTTARVHISKSWREYQPYTLGYQIGLKLHLADVFLDDAPRCLCRDVYEKRAGGGGEGKEGRLRTRENEWWAEGD